MLGVLYNYNLSSWEIDVRACTHSHNPMTDANMSNN